MSDEIVVRYTSSDKVIVTVRYRGSRSEDDIAGHGRFEDTSTISTQILNSTARRGDACSRVEAEELRGVGNMDDSLAYLAYILFQ